MTASGRPFQTWAAATGKARLPTVNSFMGGMTRRLVLAGRKDFSKGLKLKTKTLDIWSRNLVAMRVRLCPRMVSHGWSRLWSRQTKAFRNWTWGFTRPETLVLKSLAYRQHFLYSGADSSWFFHYTLHGGITRQNWYHFVQNYLKFMKMDVWHLKKCAKMSY